MFNVKGLRRITESKKEGDWSCPTCSIPNYGQDHNYADAWEQGESPETMKQNIPAMLAAKTAGGTAFGPTISNGINGTYPGNRSAYEQINPAYRKLYNGREEESFHHESVCDILNRLSYR